MQRMPPVQPVALTRGLFLLLCLLAALCLTVAPALAQPQAASSAPAAAPSARAGTGQMRHDIEANLLILNLQLDGSTLSDGLTAYQDGAQILLPLGELFNC